MNLIQRLWFWLVYSSANPKKLSLTVMAGVPLLVVLFGWAGIEESVIRPILEESSVAIVNLILGVVQLGLSLATIYGLGRKLLNTLLRK